MRDTAPAEFGRRGIRQAFEQYFALEAALAGAGLVDVLAHADVIKRHGLVPDGDLAALHAPVAAAAARTSLAVEISSIGLRHLIAEPYPGPAFLAQFQAAGVPITLASDAHMPDDAAWGLEAALRAARAAGYAEYLRFDARRPIPTPLPQLGA
jgi:histidinol-phosphatase (PHP family)